MEQGDAGTGPVDVGIFRLLLCREFKDSRPVISPEADILEPPDRYQVEVSVRLPLSFALTEATAFSLRPLAWLDLQCLPL
jgi:hypothetical protein